MNDGFQTIALKEIEEAYKAGTLEIPVNLGDVFDSGLEMDYCSYTPICSRDTHVAWMTLLHDSDQNRYRPTSIYQKIAVIEWYVQKVPGGDLKQALRLQLMPDLLPILWSPRSEELLGSNPRPSRVFLFSMSQVMVSRL